jgi:glutamate synthase (NADPH/NADH) small chain
MEQRASSSSATPTSARQRRAEKLPQGFRRHRDLRPAPPSRAICRSKGREPQGRALRDGVPHREHQGRARPAVFENGTDFIHAKGKDVVVIGGGDTGTDCVGTSMRHGCKSVTQLEIMPKPPLERAANNPWPEWPKVYKMDYGQEEAAAKFGADPRIYLTTVKKFIGDEDGNVQSVLVTVEIKWEKNDKGQFIPKEQCRHGKDPPRATRACSRWVSSDPNRRSSESASNATRARTSKAEHEKYTTNIKGVFAAGDCRRGQSLVVWAINEGRGAAPRMRPLPDGG